MTPLSHTYVCPPEPDKTIGSPSQINVSLLVVIFGKLFTKITIVLSGPMHPFANGVTVIVAATGMEVEFKPVNGAISPFPFAAKPIEVSLFIQENAVPGVALV